MPLGQNTYKVIHSSSLFSDLLAALMLEFKVHFMLDKQTTYASINFSWFLHKFLVSSLLSVVLAETKMYEAVKTTLQLRQLSTSSNTWQQPCHVSPNTATAKWPLPNAKNGTSVHQLCAAGYQLSNTHLHLARPWGLTLNASSPFINSYWLQTVFCFTSARNKRLRYSTSLTERYELIGGYWGFCVGVFWWVGILLLEQKEGLKSEHLKKWMKKTSMGNNNKAELFSKEKEALISFLGNLTASNHSHGGRRPRRFALHLCKCHLEESQSQHTSA